MLDQIAETAEGLRGRGVSSLGDAHRMMHVLWTENDLSAATDDIGCTGRSTRRWIPTINGITLIVC